METTPQMFLIGNQPMSAEFAGAKSFDFVQANSYSYLLIASDTDNGIQELFLYQKADDKYKLLARKKISVQFRQGLAQKLTGVIFQEVWYCRQHPEISLEAFLKDFGKFFSQSEFSMKLLKELSAVCVQSQIPYDKLYKIVSQLLENCKLNYLFYKKYLMEKIQHPPICTLLSSVTLDWLFFCQLASELLEEIEEWKNDDYPTLYFACYGSSYQTAMMNYIMQMPSNKETEIPNEITPAEDTDIFRLTEKTFRNTQRNIKAFTMQILNTSYETRLLKAYTKSQKDKNANAENTLLPLYAENALCLPLNSSVYVGKWQGAERIIGNVEGAENALMPAPLSEEFAALVASEKAKITEQKWIKQPNGWLFHMEYTYHDRNESNPYRPVDKYYTQEQIISIKQFPEILITQKKGQQELTILARQNFYSVDMSKAVFDGTSLKLSIPEKMPYNYMLYFKLFDSNQKYLGQFTCNLTPEKKEG